MIKRKNLSYIALGAIMALATPSRTSNTYPPLPTIVPHLEQVVDESPIARRPYIETESVERIWKRYDSSIKTAVKRHRNVRPSQVYSMIYVESRGKPMIVSPKGAVGIMQLMPITQKHLGMTRQEALNPESSIMGGVRYYAELLRRYNNNEVLALAAYNMGPRKVDSLLRVNKWDTNVTYRDLRFKVNWETRHYIADVMEKEGMIWEMFL